MARRAVVLVTGGAGFIGSALVRRLVADGQYDVVTVDKLTYAADPAALAAVADDPRHRFERVDICDAPALRRVFDRHAPAAVLHLAAESHVDRSIDGPAAFIRTNLVGTFTLLEEARRHWLRLASGDRDAFRLLHVSTDEVHGELGADGCFTEESPYRPSSPYAASKAGSDHLVRAWHRTYGLPVVLTHSSNTYGPYQHPEKLIPLMILRAAAGQALPVYGRGENVRDWLHVDDHVDALVRLLAAGRPGESYGIGGGTALRNIDLVERICDLVDELRPDPPLGRRRELIRFVADRPGHDFRYATDPSKITGETGWRPRVAFDAGLRATVAWSLALRVAPERFDPPRPRNVTPDVAGL